MVGAHARVPPQPSTALLLVLGAGLFTGNLVGGRAADRALLPALATIFAIFAVVLVVFGSAARDPIATAVMVFLFGVAGYALVPGSQLRVVATAHGAPTLASAVNISAFNVGVAAGGWLSGDVIANGHGYASVTWVSALIALVGLALTGLSAAVDRRDGAAAEQVSRLS